MRGQMREHRRASVFLGQLITRVSADVIQRKETSTKYNGDRLL